MNIRRLVLDVDKAIRQPTLIDLAKAIDGILSTLTLASGRMSGGAGDLTWGLALRIAGASSLASAFVFFAAEYTRVRGTLVREARQLSLPVRGALVRTQLGRVALHGSVARTGLSCASNLAGALLPLVPALLWPDYSWLSILVAVAVLAALGFLLARAVSGRWASWSGGLSLAGLTIAIIGAKLHIV